MFVGERFIKAGTKKPYLLVVDGCMFHMTAVAAGALSQFLKYGLIIKYQQEKHHLDLLYDNKHYQEAVEASRLGPREKSSASQYSYKFYMAISLVNIIFLYCILKRKFSRAALFRKWL